MKPKRFFSVLWILALTCPILAQEFDPSFLTHPGETVPAFSVQDTAGNTHTPQSLQGKVVLLVFFATWCPPCQKELAHLSQTVWPEWQNHPDRLILPLGREHDLEALRKFRETKGLGFPLAADPDRKVYSLFAKAGIPRSVLLDQEGRIVLQQVGFTPEGWQEMARQVEHLTPSAPERASSSK